MGVSRSPSNSPMPVSALKASLAPSNMPMLRDDTMDGILDAVVGDVTNARAQDVVVATATRSGDDFMVLIDK